MAFVKPHLDIRWYGAVGGGVADDAAAIRLAIADAVHLGIRVVFVPEGTYYIGSTITIPSNVTLRGAGRHLTTFVSGITPASNPNNATFHAAAASASGSTTLSAGNTLGARTISTAASIATGAIILINDTVSGAGLRTMSYDVVSVSGSGPYTVTLDRPVLIQYGTGDAVSVVPSQPTGIVLEDFAITGSADRFIELVSARACIVRRVRMTVTSGASHDIVHSFDVGGRFNLQEDLEVDGGAIAADCIAQEGQEGTVTRRCVTRRSTAYGIVMHDTVHAAIEDCHASNHAFGLVLTADGSVKGSLGTRVRGGSFCNNTTEGIAVVNGCTDTHILGVDARFNPKALTADTTTVGLVAQGCNLSAHTTNAVAVGSGAVGVRFDDCDLSGDATTVSISAAGDVNFHNCRITACKQIGLFTGKVTFSQCYMKCNPVSAQNVLYLSSGSPRVSLVECQIECATNSCNVVSIAAGVCTIAQTTITATGGATGVLGMYISAGSLFIGAGVDASGCGTPLSSAGGTTKLVTETTVTTMPSPS